MSSLSRLRLFYLLHLSQPASHRQIYKELRQQKPKKIVEVGIGDAQRALRMIELLTESHAPQEIQYTGIDLFEDRSEAEGPRMSLREAYRVLRATGVTVRLVPGTFADGLSRVANSLSQIDLVVVSGNAQIEQEARAWFYIPRLLHQGSHVFLETSTAGGGSTIRTISHDELRNLGAVTRRRAA